MYVLLAYPSHVHVAINILIISTYLGSMTTYFLPRPGYRFPTEQDTSAKLNYRSEFNGDRVAPLLTHQRKGAVSVTLLLEFIS